MAGDWIKMRADLFTHPKVVRMASALKADTLRTVGGLMSAWCLFDAHSEDGWLDGYTPETLDEHLRWKGFSAAMIAVKWLLEDERGGLKLPEFSTHNGQSAKRRAQDAERKKDVRKASASEADKMRTREEKRREEKEQKKEHEKTPPPAGADGSGGNPPIQPKSSTAVEIDTWLSSLTTDADAIPATDPIFDYAEKTGIPVDFLELSWWRFVENMRSNRKRKRDWRAHYRNAVRGNWGKLWFFAPDGSCQLTTAGEQARRAVA